MPAPSVSVVMPVYDGARFLRAALDSVLAQSHGDFELLVVDDGSTDETAAILAGCRDPRLYIVRNPRNLGVTRALNLGLEAARGRYIARMDADDIAHPERFAVQVRLLEAEPRLSAVGTGYTLIDAEGRFLKRDVQALPPRLCRWVGLFRTPILHPSAMIRAETVRAHGLRYDERFPAAEDFAFWSELFRHGEAMVVGAPLMRYRWHAASVTGSRRETQRASMQRICAANLGREMPDADPADVAAFTQPFYARRRAVAGDVARAVRLVSGVLDSFAAGRGMTAQERWIAAGFGARWLALALLVHGRGLRDPAVLARLPAMLPAFGLPLLAELPRALLARLPYPAAPA